MSQAIDSNGKKIYKKEQSFNTFVSNLGTDISVQKERTLKSLTLFVDSSDEKKRVDVVQKALCDLENSNPQAVDFKLTTPIADEISKLSDEDIPRYIYHRYRYDVYPRKNMLDNYPPYLQIEPTSICNFRCVFCYQTDVAFTKKSEGFMGSMDFDLFKEIIDQCVDKVEFFSLASRGEPLICKDIVKMVEYCRGKFLGLKMNTNASMLTEEKCHAILSGGINTLVFSADAAVEPLYSQMRVNGKLEKVLANIRMFRSIKEKQYSKSKIITRVSGVKFKTEQSMESMRDVWGELVDQICFVDYNPWENVYDAPESNVDKPCSDLWRRMFIWFDGKANPCDTDYKSHLMVGQQQGKSITDLWRSESYESLRQAHLNNKRSNVEPCRRCTVI